MKKATQKPKGKPEFVFQGFVRYDLLKEEKELLKNQAIDFEKLLDTMESAIEHGYTFKFSKDNYNKCYQCAVTVSDPEHENSGWFVVGRGSIAIKALRQTLYICDQTSWQFAEFMDGKISKADFLDD